jgi:hypothetical protein
VPSAGDLPAPLLLRAPRGMQRRAWCRVGALVTLLTAADGCLTEEDVAAQLIASYGNPAMRPSVAAAKQNGTVSAAIPSDSIELQLSISRLHAIDQIKQTWGVDGILRMWWADPSRLSFSDPCARRLRLTSAQAAQVWQPSFYWEKAIDVSSPSDSRLGTESSMEISPTGRVYLSQQVSLKLACPLTLTALPFDVQECSYLMGLYSHSQDQVVLNWRAGRDALADWKTSCIAECVSLTRHHMIDHTSAGSVASRANLAHVPAANLAVAAGTWPFASCRTRPPSRTRGTRTRTRAPTSRLHVAARHSCSITSCRSRG